MGGRTVLQMHTACSFSAAPRRAPLRQPVRLRAGPPRSAYHKRAGRDVRVSGARSVLVAAIVSSLCACGTTDVYVGSDLPVTQGDRTDASVDAGQSPDPPGAPRPDAGASAADAAQACETGFADCNGDPDDACEVDLTTDGSNCGECAHACPTGFIFEAPGGAQCIDGTCVLACELLHGDCDGNLTNGCETSLFLSDQNCGACGVVCTCQNGQCL